jgi:uncharacterized glyoxalase superfamily protein PhnB
MNRTYPGFYVVDINTSIAWYKDFLGYECTFKVRDEDITPYAIVSKGDISIHLAHDPTGTHIGAGFCYIETDDVVSIYDELNGAGVIFVREIEDSAYGMRDFVIKDYEGNKISFGEKT